MRVYDLALSIDYEVEFYSYRSDKGMTTKANDVSTPEACSGSGP
jgi:hypothetical protein